jgi:hypothetical protein
LLFCTVAVGSTFAEAWIMNNKNERLSNRERKLRKRLRGFKRKAARRGTVIVSPDGGPPCPSCRKPGEIDEHAAITDKLLRQTSYFTRFFRCRNPDCLVTLYYEEKYRVWNKPPQTAAGRSRNYPDCDGGYATGYCHTRCRAEHPENATTTAPSVAPAQSATTKNVSLTVTETSQGWIVADGGQIIAGPFPTNAEAWRWIDRSQGDPISRAEQVSQWIFDKEATQ